MEMKIKKGAMPIDSSDLLKDLILYDRIRPEDFLEDKKFYEEIWNACGVITDFFDVLNNAGLIKGWDDDI